MACSRWSVAGDDGGGLMVVARKTRIIGQTECDKIEIVILSQTSVNML